jgi:hypothetical protein
MNKLFWGIIAAGLVLCTGGLANAAEENSPNNRFRDTQNAEFNGDTVPKNCRVKTYKTRERVGTWERDVIYELCTQNSKPLYLKESYDAGENGKVDKVTRKVFSYKKGKLVRIDHTTLSASAGFRNGQPVVERSDLDEQMNWDLSKESKELFQSLADESKHILKKFGIRSSLQ